MGLFDYIGGKIEKASEEAREAERRAEGWDAIRICRELQKTSSMTRSNGYMKALRSKCENMSEWELKYTFDEAFNSRNAKACNAMMPVMSDRGLAYKDENGKIVRNYR